MTNLSIIAFVMTAGAARNGSCKSSCVLVKRSIATRAVSLAVFVKNRAAIVRHFGLWARGLRQVSLQLLLRLHHAR